MDLEQPLFSKRHLQQPRDSKPQELDPGNIEGESFRVRVHSLVVGDIAHIRELSFEPDLYEAIYLVDCIVECLEGTKVSDLASYEIVRGLVDDLRIHTEDGITQEIRGELESSKRIELAQEFENFMVAGRELLSKLDEFDGVRNADPVRRFELLQPVLAKIIAAHKEFYLKFRETSKPNPSDADPPA